MRPFQTLGVVVWIQGIASPSAWFRIFVLRPGPQANKQTNKRASNKEQASKERKQEKKERNKQGSLYATCRKFQDFVTEALYWDPLSKLPPLILKVKVGEVIEHHGSMQTDDKWREFFHSKNTADACRPITPCKGSLKNKNKNQKTPQKQNKKKKTRKTPQKQTNPPPKTTTTTTTTKQTNKKTHLRPKVLQRFVHS